MNKITKAIVFTLILTVTMVMSAPVNGWAMLAPSREAGSSQRAADMKTIQTTLESKIVRERLQTLGLSEKEIELRLGQLSDQELHKLAKDVDTLAAGGIIEAVLVVVVLVLLILFLVKRV